MNHLFSIKTDILIAWLLINLFVALNPAFTQPLTLTTPLLVRWSYFSDSLTGVTPSGDMNDIYVPLLPSELVSLGGGDGLLRWKADIGGDISCPPVFDAQRVYIISESQAFGDANRKTFGVVRAISRASGVTLWVREFPRPFRRGLSANSVSLFASLDDGRLYSIDKFTGETRWLVQSSYRGPDTPLLEADKIYALTGDGYLIAISQRTGKTLQRYRTGGAVRPQVSVQQGTLYFATDDGYISALRERRGNLALLWRKRAGAGLQDITATPEGVLVTARDNFVLLLESNRGKRLWKRQMPARLAVPPSLGYGTALFSPLGEEACIALSLRDGRVINSLPIGKDNNVVASPLIVGNLVLIPTRKGLMAFAPAEQSTNPASPSPHTKRDPVAGEQLIRATHVSSGATEGR
ncbi:MAG TPA: PQQ-binding-like beta-propeller repeat protein [Pyrinomonadaceae bacterium]|jgi:outer membrane protein assembly factor BamB|nr:PQQ-binding-like beta-propeller repeat protein [Pyrinomonadaceae bacterium]